VQKEKDQEEKYKEHKINFKGAHLHDGWADLIEIWNGMSLP